MNAGILSNLFHVGAEKPLAYRPLRTIRDVCGIDLDHIQDELRNTWKLSTALYSDAECHVAGGALYAWHEPSLKHLLDKNMDILKEAGWPAEPWEFVNCVSSRTVPVKTKLFDLVADAYGDRMNPGRTDIPAPDVTTS
jgi:hypothetical protein